MIILGGRGERIIELRFELGWLIEFDVDFWFFFFGEVWIYYIIGSIIRKCIRIRYFFMVYGKLFLFFGSFSFGRI